MWVTSLRTASLLASAIQMRGEFRFDGARQPAFAWIVRVFGFDRAFVLSDTEFRSRYAFTGAPFDVQERRIQSLRVPRASRSRRRRVT